MFESEGWVCGRATGAKKPVLATYDIRRPKCEFPSSIASLFTTDMFNERGLGYVLIITDRNTVTLIPTFLLFQGKPQEMACSVTTPRYV